MAKVLNDNLMVCADCYTLIGTGDSSSFDYDYDPDDAETRLKECSEGIAAACGCRAGHPRAVLYAGDAEKDKEFSRERCDCCGTRLAGSRHHCIVLE